MRDTGLAQGLRDPSGRQAPVTNSDHQEHEEGILHLWEEVRKKNKSNGELDAQRGGDGARDLFLPLTSILFSGRKAGT